MTFSHSPCLDENEEGADCTHGAGGADRGVHAGAHAAFQAIRLRMCLPVPHHVFDCVGWIAAALGPPAPRQPWGMNSEGKLPLYFQGFSGISRRFAWAGMVLAIEDA